MKFFTHADHRRCRNDAARRAPDRSATVQKRGRAVGPFPCADHRAIEVERHAREPKGHKPGHDSLPHESLQALWTRPPSPIPERAWRYRADGAARSSARPRDHPNSSANRATAGSQRRVKHQTQHQRGVSEDRADGEMAEAAAQPFLEPQMSEQRLDWTLLYCMGRGLLRICGCFHKHIIP